LRHLGPAAVVVTAGAAGAADSWLDDSELVAAPDVPVVDTTGAGDAFPWLPCLEPVAGA
jgi:ribokinase